MGLFQKKGILAIAILLLTISSAFSPLGVRAFSSGKTYPPTFHMYAGDWYDSFGFDRNYYGGSNGYFPNIAYETLGSNKELAYGIGGQFKASYPDDNQRAEAILKFVQRWTNYGYDSDNVIMDGVHQDEWAWNADEMAHMFNQTTGAVAIGDCEDLAFLCATLYIAAGYDVAMVLTSDHVALLIWLPRYSNADYYWDLPNDGRGAGWIWVESTGKENPLGWTPPDFSNGDFYAVPLNMISVDLDYAPQQPQSGDEVTVEATVNGLASTISQVWLNYSTGGGIFTSVAMKLEGSSYVAVIPGEPKGTDVKFVVSAADAAGEVGQSDVFTYDVGVPISGCIIATATYGSELSPQVQLLRGFRDNIALKTFAGSSFMTVFNTWYYSWSPPVAVTIAPSGYLRSVMQVILQPILSILQVATAAFYTFSCNAEFAIVMAGLIASVLIGLIYLTPFFTLAFLVFKRWKGDATLPAATSAMRKTAMPWLASVALILIAELTLSPSMMMVASAAFVILTIVMTVSATSLWLANLLDRG